MACDFIIKQNVLFNLTNNKNEDFMKNSSLIIILISVINIAMFAQMKFVQTNGPFGGKAKYIIVDPRDIIYASTSSGLYRSTNNGDNWTRLNLNVFNPKIAVNPAGSVLVVSDETIYLSKDNGKTWIQHNHQLSSVVCTGLSSDNCIYIGTSEGLFISGDNGETINKYGFGKSAIGSILINSEDNVFISSSDGIHFSNDGGRTFKDMGLYVPNIFLIAENSLGYVYAASGTTLYNTTNKGKKWTELKWVDTTRDYSQDDVYISYLSIDPAGRIHLIIYMWYEGKYYQYLISADNGKSWKTIEFQSRGSYSEVNSKGHIFSSLNDDSYSDIYRSMDNGKTWSECSNGLISSNIYSIAISPEGELFSISNDVLSWSKNKGNKWNSSKLEDPAYYSKEIFINSKNDLYVFDYIAGEGIFSNFKIMLSKDKGKTWRTITENSEIDLCAMGVDSRDNLYLIQRGKGKIIKSTDNGENWTYFCDVDKSEYYYAIHFNLYDDIFVQTYELLLRSTDKGVSWRNINHSVKFNEIFITESGAIFALGTNNEYEQSLYISNDNGNNWKKIHRFDSSLAIQDIVLDEDGYLYFGTEGNGVWRSTKPFQF